MRFTNSSLIALLVLIAAGVLYLIGKLAIVEAVLFIALALALVVPIWYDPRT